MKKLFSLLILLTVVLTLSAQEQKREIIIKREGMMKANPAQLAPRFTPEQQKQMAAFKLNLQKEMIQFDNQLNEKRAQLKTLQQVDKPDMKSIYSKIDEITALQNKKMKASATHQNNVRSILTEEQRIKFDMNSGDRGKHFMMEQGRKMMMHKKGDEMRMDQGRRMNMQQEGMHMQQGMKMEQGGMKMEQRERIIRQGGKVIRDTIVIKN